MMTSDLSERQERFLGLVVRTYIETGQAVGSHKLVEAYELPVSSATVRNELAALGEMGYLEQQHTSAGRIPTEAGYRYFVQKLLGEFRLPVREQQMIRHQFHQARLELEQWMRLAAAILANTSHSASFVTAPRLAANRFKHLELISTQGRLVLMILVFHGGEVVQQMLTLAEPISQTELSAAAERINNRYYDLNRSEIAARRGQLGELESEISGLLLEALERVDVRPISHIYRDGLLNIMDDVGTRQAVKVLEERTLLAHVLAETQPSGGGGVQVVIGGDGRWEELKECSLILSRYGIEEEFAGTVAVLGPTRMSYGRNVAAVQYVADLMSGLVVEYYSDSGNEQKLKGGEE